MTRTHATLDLRISDNVLDDKDWTTARITVTDGVVVARHITTEGAHDARGLPAIDASLAAVAEWLRYDGSGTHPEVSHDFRQPGSQGPWRSHIATGELYTLLGMAHLLPKARPWRIEFRSGTFFQNLEADNGGPAVSAMLFESEKEANAFMQKHDWILFNGGMATTKVPG